MSHLCVFHNSNTRQPVRLLNHHDDIARELAEINVQFERMEPAVMLTARNSQAEVLKACQEQLNQLRERNDQLVADVLVLDESQPEKERNLQRTRLLAERVYDAEETCLQVVGRSLYSLRAGEQVYSLMCEKGDVLRIPAGMARWFDAGEHPRAVVLRLQDQDAGQEGCLTGENPASEYPQFDDY